MAGQLKWDDANFETLVEESGSKIEFPEVGSQFIGIYQGANTITFEDAEGEQSFVQHSFRDQDGMLHVLNGGFKLDTGLANVEKGKLVRITRAADVPMKNQPSPMKDYRIDVAK